MELCDAHIHLSDFNYSEEYLKNYLCTSTHKYDDFLQCKKIQSLNKNVLISFGVHPQLLIQDNLLLLETLLKNNEIDVIGECGIDLFTLEYVKTLEEQKKFFFSQLNLAIEFKKPIIIHCRKAINNLFEYTKLLKQVPSVVFHSFPGSVVEANSFLNKGLNAFFSFGSPILNKRRLSIDCVKQLPVERLLLETDSPYQLLKDEKNPNPNRLAEVYKKASEIRNIEMSNLQVIIKENFLTAFCL